MKIRAMVSCVAVSLVSIHAAVASAQSRPYVGSDSLELFIETVVARCQGLGGSYAGVSDLDFYGGGSTSAGSVMRNGVQDIAPQTRPLSQSEYCDNDIPAALTGEAALNATVDTTFTPGARADNLAVAVEALALMTSRGSAERCDADGTSGVGTGLPQDFGAALAHGTSFPVTDFPDDGVPPPVASYSFDSWRDVLRVLLAGADNTRLPANGGGTGQAAANRVARCTSDIRRSLVASWDHIIEGEAPCAASAGSCQSATTGAGLPLRHVFRYADLSRISDALLGLLGLASNPASETFCNGLDTEDEDPIRVRCTTSSVNPGAPINDNAAQLNDEVCGVDQTLGLVAPVRIPLFVGTNNTATIAGNRTQPTRDDLFPAYNCATGMFAIRRPPGPVAAPPVCPDGAPYMFTGCLTPVAAPGSIVPEDPSIPNDAPGEADCDCINAWTNRAPLAPDRNPAIGGVQNDGRLWNRILRGHPGRYGNPANPCPVLRDELGNEGVGFNFRMRSRSTTVNGHAVPADRVCRERDPGRAIGCLSRAAECAIGVAGREAVLDASDDPATPSIDESYDAPTALILGNKDGVSAATGPASAAIYSGLTGSGYPLGRWLYLNSIVGFESILPLGDAITFNDPQGNPVTLQGLGQRLPGQTPRESVQLMQCLANEAGPIEEALAANGFLPAQSSGAPTPFLRTDIEYLACP